MISTYSKAEPGIKWLRNRFSSNTCLLIPQFNEGEKNGFKERLDYFHRLSEEFKGCLDVILIDDGSTDNSMDQIISFIDSRIDSFSVASVYPNRQKVGALNLTAMSVTHEFVILSDFDTDLDGLENLLIQIDLWRNDTSHMGYYFRMIPFEGKGKIFQFQQLEYCFARVLYKFHEKERTVPVMPGAGCCFKRDILLSIYRGHSGLRSGEDREATAIGTKMGYNVSYMDSVTALTRPPLTYSGLVRQRIRWNLGYLEAFFFQKKYYLSQMSKLSKVGIRALCDIFFICFLLSLPLLIVGGLMLKLNLFAFIVGFYLLHIVWSVVLLNISPKECMEFKSRLPEYILLFPVIKIAVEYVAWMGAIRRFSKGTYAKLSLRSFS